MLQGTGYTPTISTQRQAQNLRAIVAQARGDAAAVALAWTIAADVTDEHEFIRQYERVARECLALDARDYDGGRVVIRGGDVIELTPCPIQPLDAEIPF